MTIADMLQRTRTYDVTVYGDTGVAIDDTLVLSEPIVVPTSKYSYAIGDNAVPEIITAIAASYDYAVPALGVVTNVQIKERV